MVGIIPFRAQMYRNEFHVVDDHVFMSQYHNKNNRVSQFDDYKIQLMFFTSHFHMLYALHVFTNITLI